MQITASPIQSRVSCARPFYNKLDFFEGFTFDRIEESSLQCAKLNLPFNEIVLCTLLNRLKSDWLVDRVA